MLLDTTKIGGRSGSRKSEIAADKPKEGSWLDKRLSGGRVQRFSEVKTVGPSLAQEMLRYNSTNRPIQPARVARYAAAMGAGRWRLTAEALAFDTNGKLLNGQHRLNAVVESGCSIDFSVWFGCHPDEFMVIDQPRGRTAGDHLAIDGFDHYNRRAALALICLRIDTGEFKSFDTETVRAKAHEMAGPLLTQSLAVGARGRKVTHEGAATLAYWWIGSNTAFQGRLESFFEALITGANLPPRSAILRLREWLRIANPTSAGTTRDRTIKEAAAIIIAWNAWTKGKVAPNFTWPHVIKMPAVV